MGFYLFCLGGKEKRIAIHTCNYNSELKPVTAEGFLSSSFARHDIKLIINSLHLDIIINVLHTVHYTFSLVLTRRF